MAGVEHHLHGGVTGSNHLSASGADGDALAQDLLAERRIVDLADRNGLSVHRGVDHQIVCMRRLAQQFVK